MTSAIFAACGDNSFGPGVQSATCRGGFDFTVLFEESILSILPAACFLILAPLRAAHLFKARIKVKRHSLHTVKICTISIYACLQLAVLVLWTRTASFTTRSSVASAALSLAVALGLALLSHLEHKKSIRPSFFISFYLFASLVLDIARVRTQWLLPSNGAAAGVLTASIAVKAIILLVETVEKRRLLLASYHHLSTENTSGIFNRGVFWWLNTLLLRGFRSILSVDDLITINEKLASRSLSDSLQSKWDNSRHQRRKHALVCETLVILRWDVLSIILPRFLLVALSVAQPFLINEAVNYIETSSAKSKNTGYGLIGAFAFVYTGSAITTGWYQHLNFRLMAKIRSSLIAVIYQKLLSLKSANANDSAAVTLMGTEVDRIAESLYLLVSELAANVVQMAIAIWLLERQLGAVCIAPIIVACVATFISAKASTFVTSRQKIWLEAIQERVNFTSEIMGSMTNVKMLGLTEKMTTVIQAMRVKELNLSKRFRRLSSLNVCIVNLPQIFSQILTFAAFAIVAKVQRGDSLSVSVAITSLSILTLLSTPLAHLLYALPQGVAALGCFQRIQSFLSEEARQDNRIFPSDSSQFSADSGPVGADMVSHIDGIELISTINMHKDIRHKSASQDEPVIVSNGSFGWSEVSPSVIQNVQIQIPWSAQLTIIVGSVGCGKSTFLKAILGETSNMSGTMSLKYRDIAFCDQSPWIINDSIRNNIIGESEFDYGWYASVTRACALDVDLQRMPNHDATLLGSKGVILSGGQKQRLAIARAVYARQKLAVFDDVFSGLDTITEELVFSRVFGQQGLLRQTGTTVILATHGVHWLPEADHLIVLGKDGNVLEQGTFKTLSEAGNYIHNLEQTRNNGQSSETNIDNSHIEMEREIITGPIQTSRLPVDESRQTGDWRIYTYYINSLGWLSLFTFSLLITANATFGVFQYVWVTWWSESSSGGNLGYWLGIYAVFGILTGIALTFSVFYMYVVIVPKSANNLHWTVLKAAMRAPMSFFVETETGVLINRFSQDMRLIDMTLPGALVAVSFYLSSAISIGILVSASVGYFAISLPFIIGILYCVQRFYLRTSRQLRLLELETKAPIYSHFIESLNGLTTIRAFGWQAAYKNKLLKLLDTSQKPYYLLFCIQRWLILVLDLIVAGMVTLLVTIAVFLRSKTSAGFLGVSLVLMMDIAQTLAELINLWTSLETSLGAVARIKNFSATTPSELLPEENVIPQQEWPAEGSLSFESVSASYNLDQPPVLNEISLSIGGGQKVGICGRTGSGKSSLLLSILRMIELNSGKIMIDGYDISTLPRPLIRQKLICLTQQPFLFTGSVRLNADPLDEAADSRIADVLKKVELWEVILRKIGIDGADVASVLDTNMDANFFSHGQRQLFCLARAMLKNGSILLLDEPTSSVDMKTDSQMQALIRSEFKHQTIIMIAHRLDSLLDFDRIVVLDKGKVVEFGEPQALLKQEGSAFSRLRYG